MFGKRGKEEKNTKNERRPDGTGIAGQNRAVRQQDNKQNEQPPQKKSSKVFETVDPRSGSQPKSVMCAKNANVQERRASRALQGGTKRESPVERYVRESAIAAVIVRRQIVHGHIVSSRDCAGEEKGVNGRIASSRLCVFLGDHICEKRGDIKVSRCPVGSRVHEELVRKRVDWVKGWVI